MEALVTANRDNRVSCLRRENQVFTEFTMTDAGFFKVSECNFSIFIRESRGNYHSIVSTLISAFLLSNKSLSGPKALLFAQPSRFSLVLVIFFVFLFSCFVCFHCFIPYDCLHLENIVYSVTLSLLIHFFSFLI